MLNSSFVRSNLCAAKFEDSFFIDVNFHNADLRDASFERTVCRRCDFRGADLRGAVFINSEFRESRIDGLTKIPFSRQSAELKGFKFEP